MYVKVILHKIFFYVQEASEDEEPEIRVVAKCSMDPEDEEQLVNACILKFIFYSLTVMFNLLYLLDSPNFWSDYPIF